MESSTSRVLSTNLLGGYEPAKIKVETGIQILFDYAAFFKERAKLELGYATTLKTITSKIPGTGIIFKEAAVTREQKTLRESLMSVHEETGKLVATHEELSRNLNECAKTLESHAKAADLEKKKLVTEGAKLFKTIGDLTAAMNKAKDNYHHYAKAEDTAKAAYEKLEADSSDAKKQAAAEKAKVKFTQAQEKTESCEKAYRDAITAYNDAIQSAYTVNIPTLLLAFEKLEKERFELLVSSVESVAEFLLSVPSAIEDHANTLKDKMRTASFAADMNDFVESQLNVGISAGAPAKAKFIPAEGRDGKPEDDVEKETSTPATKDSPVPQTRATPHVEPAKESSQTSGKDRSQEEAEEEELLG